mmetsp:Transcript_47151/g.137119  ORF Transcript_47151/g.137119 Transcript_47151/m.137119 type:complete len:608 (+) Transcript_47151:337-2160(+)
MCAREVVAGGQRAPPRAPPGRAHPGLLLVALLREPVSLDEDGVHVLVESDLPSPPLGVAQIRAEIFALVQEAVVVRSDEIVGELPPTLDDLPLRAHLPLRECLGSFPPGSGLDDGHLVGDLLVPLCPKRKDEVFGGVAPVHQRGPIRDEVERPEGGVAREPVQSAPGQLGRMRAARRGVEGQVDGGHRGVGREPQNGLGDMRRPALADHGVRGPRDGDAARDLPQGARRVAALEAERVAERPGQDALGEVELTALVNVAEPCEHVLAAQGAFDLDGAGQVEGVDGEHISDCLRRCELRQPPLAEGGIQRDGRRAGGRLEGDCVRREDPREVKRLLSIPNAGSARRGAQLRGEEPLVRRRLGHMSQDEIVRDKGGMPLGQTHRRPDGLRDARNAADDVEDPSLAMAVGHGQALAAIIEGHLPVRLDAQAPLTDHGAKAVLVRHGAHGLDGAARRLAPLHRDLHDVRQVEQGLHGRPVEARVAVFRGAADGVIQEPRGATGFSHGQALFVHHRQGALPIAVCSSHLWNVAHALRQVLASLWLVELSAAIADETRRRAGEDVDRPLRPLRVLGAGDPSDARVAGVAVRVHPSVGSPTLGSMPVDGHGGAA